ncbi:MAG: glycosyltransferase family 39 protein [Armatimonas sp.]
MALSDEEREKLAAKYESPAWKPSPVVVPPVWKNARAGVWATILLVFFWLLSTTRVPLQRCDDFYVYVGAASIASGQGFSDISRPDKPPLLKYPPLRSLIQVPFLPLLKDNIRPLRYVAIFCFAVGLFVLYPVLRRLLTHRQALFVLLAIGFNSATVRVANFEGNAGITFLLWILTYRVVDKFVEKPGNPIASGAILGGLLTLCFYCHRMAFSLIPVVLLYLYWRKQQKVAAIAGAITLLCCFPWLLRSWQYSGHWISPEYEWEITTRIEQSSTQSRGGLLQTILYAAKELLKLPLEIGYGLFPWWKGSGGAPWQLLSKLHLEIIGPVSSYIVGLLSLFGFVKQIREKRSVAEFHFIAHCLMLALFFMAFQYLIIFIPYFYLWLFVGLQPWPKIRRVVLLLCLSISIAKSIVAFWFFPAALEDKDVRWAWVPKVVPASDTVYYLGLDNYALAPLRWFDTNRMAMGVTEAEIQRILDYGKNQSIHWVSLPINHPLANSLEANGWTQVAWENLSDTPPEMQSALSDAQRNFLRLREGPQALWKRPD